MKFIRRIKDTAAWYQLYTILEKNIFKQNKIENVYNVHVGRSTCIPF